jgi:hypothetical protein
MKFAFTSASASGFFPSSNSFWISGKTLCASGRSASWREPDQTELSFKTIFSSFRQPNIKAPSRPLPSGVDSVKFVAAVSNQIVVSAEIEDCAGATQSGSAERITRADTQAFVLIIPRRFKARVLSYAQTAGNGHPTERHGQLADCRTLISPHTTLPWLITISTIWPRCRGTGAIRAYEAMLYGANSNTGPLICSAIRPRATAKDYALNREPLCPTPWQFSSSSQAKFPYYPVPLLQ